MRVKERLLRGARRAGLMALVRDSAWRRQRMLVLCYHGVARHDEDEWSPELYITPARLRQRLQFLRDGGYTILPLRDATRRLYDGTLPERTVALTFDDGTVDFAETAVPILREFNAPATLYLTTYYSIARLPVFDTMLAYVLWRGRGHPVPDFKLHGQDVPLVAEDEVALLRTWSLVYDVVLRRELNTHARDQVLALIADAMGVDYAEIKSRSTMRIMPPETVQALPADLIDVQLHTHRHRMPQDHAAFARELMDNARAIRETRGEDVKLDQFCYPSGVYHTSAFAWLREQGVRFATTCEPALASPRTDPLLLPRYVDSMEQSAVTFEAWVSGFAALFPRHTPGPQIETAYATAPLRKPWKMMRGTPSARSST
jgi:peptidoglycan/xylan/chitin deacetylase (PgdA/CDA1 family)